MMMDKAQCLELQSFYRKELMENVVPFWAKHSLDREYGGYLTCLARDGSVYDTDKFAWMQGRTLWGFAKAYNEYGRDPALLEAAHLGAAFIRQHAYAPGGDVYFSMERDGTPLVSPYNIFSECFVCAGMAEYYRATGEAWAKEEAVRLYRRVQERKANPKGIWTKPVPGVRPLCPMNMIMIEFMLYRELRGVVDEGELQPILRANIDTFFRRHVDRERKQVFERMLPDGSHLFEHMEGRLLTPGHALEALWFLMDIVQLLGEDDMVRDIADIMLWVIRPGWDEERGGIPLYKDALGLPGEKLEANQRHWWVHIEALCAFLLACKLTGSQEHRQWFERIQAYTLAHFRDPEYGEWYAYLDRYGNPEFTIKGGKWKTLYHLPRGLMQIERWLGQMAEA